jgi:hypothetical protein
VYSLNTNQFLQHDIDPKKPDEINDSKTFGQPGEVQHKVAGSLKRCQ